MKTIEMKSFASPDETKKPVENVKVEVVTVGGLEFQQVTVQPGWKWTTDLAPIMKTDSCQKDHLMYVISGEFYAKMDDGKEEKFVAGDVVSVPPGHDGWNDGSEPAVWLEIPH